MNTGEKLKEEVEEMNKRQGEVVDAMFTIPKHRTRIHSLLAQAFHPDTQEGEALNSFVAARKLLAKEGVRITEVIRPEWGGGPLSAALEKYGRVVMPSGKYRGGLMGDVMRDDPAYLTMLINTGGLDSASKEGKALKALVTAYESEMVCWMTGEWSTKFSIDSLWAPPKSKDPE